jgi:ZIP family zinc transporter
MSTTQLLVLGALAGFTIFLGLPIGRIKSASTRLKAALSAMATGILLFLLWDVIVHGIEPVEEALKSATDEGGSWVDFARLAVTFAAGATIGLMSLVYYDRWFGRQRGKAMLGPGAASWQSSTARGGRPLASCVARARSRPASGSQHFSRGSRSASPLGPGDARSS